MPTFRVKLTIACILFLLWYSNWIWHHVRDNARVLGCIYEDIETEPLWMSTPCSLVQGTDSPTEWRKQPMIISVEQKTNLHERYSPYHPKMDVRVKCQFSCLTHMHCFHYVVTKVFEMLITPKEWLFTLSWRMLYLFCQLGVCCSNWKI
jgi:hypothetical protein